MDKAHNIHDKKLSGKFLSFYVNRRHYEIDITEFSDLLAVATKEQMENFDISPSGYGFHWPDIDEDLSIDGFIGVEHQCPLTKSSN
ncbi:MAG: hypothetical protein A2161_14675 [Candidatus Schekmanbacteria bacterium RBG_13_48_7]|uniref:DUF2442 domain-containing protein n=1 Tax=Candidatus Schekmanbacteria bacterium RBG_13_48_7 TaxID=1817878 RepID=A0A1F7RUK5_9BACT|nr:MAG: hypothetical protein A2161_14675 [Candidatus Schekmanbacteria bacterium RBG_13_48_7]